MKKNAIILIFVLATMICTTPEAQISIKFGVKAGAYCLFISS